MAAVLSPQFSFTDLHMGSRSAKRLVVLQRSTLTSTLLCSDSGTHVLSTTLETCVKLWACYPPTTKNLDSVYRWRDDEHKFIRLSPSLEHEYYMVVDDKESVFLPSGWLHAVYTLSGAVLVGINWVSEVDIMLAERYFIHETMSKDCRSRDIVAYVHALSLGVQSTIEGRQEVALQSWCRQRKALGELARDKRLRTFRAHIMRLGKKTIGLGNIKCEACGLYAQSHTA